MVFLCIYPNLTALNIKFMGSYLIAWKLNDSDILSKFKMSKKFGKKKLDWGKLDCLILLFCFCLFFFYKDFFKWRIRNCQYQASGWEPTVC